ncbi:vesicular glutamate transporter 1-like isoform X1 [Branchiostoma lanceolatum]|uniref:vesicular glutamate transporter 1-like isoform X1 n=1 Tax=Branchiostoma lanceolatum TaxID=7740 RepID=UPI003455B74C
MEFPMAAFHSTYSYYRMAPNRISLDPKDNEKNSSFLPESWTNKLWSGSETDGSSFFCPCPSVKVLWDRLGEATTCRSGFMPKRYIVAVLACIGFMIQYGIRTNLGIAVVDMVNNHTLGDLQVPAPFHWSQLTVGIIHGSFFWGFLLTKVLGGYLAVRFPANRVFGASVLCSACLHMVVPVAADLHYGVLIFVRILQGLSEGMTFPSSYGVLSKWAPPLERSRLTSIMVTGQYAGILFGMPLSGVVTEYAGWPYPFYMYGAFGITWSVIWALCVWESPSKDPTVSEEECLFIEKSLGEFYQSSNHQSTAQETPWKEILTSAPVYAILVTDTAFKWTLYLLLTNSPSYYMQAFDMQVEASGLITGMPFLFLALCLPIAGSVGDWMRTKEVMSTTNVRRLFNTVGLSLEALCFLIIGCTNSSVASMTLLSVGMASAGLTLSSGYNVNALDISPRYASIIMGLSGAIATFSGILCPIVVGTITVDKTAKQWGYVFIISAVILIASVVVYFFLASGETQPWSNPKPPSVDTDADDEEDVFVKKSKMPEWAKKPKMPEWAKKPKMPEWFRTAGDGKPNEPEPQDEAADAGRKDTDKLMAHHLVDDGSPIDWVDESVNFVQIDPENPYMYNTERDF